MSEKIKVIDGFIEVGDYVWFVLRTFNSNKYDLCCFHVIETFDSTKSMLIPLGSSDGAPTMYTVNNDNFNVNFYKERENAEAEIVMRTLIDAE